MPDTLFTIGYEGVTVDAVVATLKASGVEMLIDVRAVPLSRRPGFSKNKLAARLGENGIGYTLLKGLGTPAEGRAAARKGRILEMRKIFTAHLGTDIAITEMERAVEIARTIPSCLLCFEHQANECHRLLVADEIAHKTGMKIRHLDPQIGYFL